MLPLILSPLHTRFWRELLIDPLQEFHSGILPNKPYTFVIVGSVHGNALQQSSFKMFPGKKVCEDMRDVCVC